jgi:release factor glutamine methyltransferase
VTFRCADCFEVLDGGPALDVFELIVSNPPYLDDAEIAALDLDVRGYEPLVALSAGVDGLDVLRRIANGAAAHLASDGELIVEVNPVHFGDVVSLLARAGLSVVGMINDFAGKSRVVQARKPGKSEWKK